MDDDRIDLSPLDPSRNGAKWEAMIRKTMQRSFKPLVHPMWSSMVSSGRFLLAAAALIAAVAWVPGLLRGNQHTRSSSTSTDAVASLADWAEDGQVPSSVDLVDSLNASSLQ